MPIKDHVVIFEGRVQGVFFRKLVKSIADSLHIKGEVENLKTGEVRAVFQGEEDKVNKLIEKLSKNTNVKDYSVYMEKSTEIFKDFKIIASKNIFLDKSAALKNRINFELKNIRGGFKLFSGVNNLENIPQHIVIIPDGNRRWAKDRGLPASMGHYVGLYKSVKEILNAAKNIDKLKTLTIWCFSTENWKRDSEEVDYLMSLFLKLLNDEKENILNENFSIKHIGRKDRLSSDVLNAINKVEEQTSGRAKTLCLAIDYGGRDEIVRAIQKINIPLNEVTEESFSKLLDTKDFKDPDLVIRTSGEFRLSGILPWQTTYAEFYFTEKKFPEFRGKEFLEAIKEYSNRKRRFGK